MEKRDIETLVQFNFWADGRILAACEQLGFEQLKQPISPDPGWGNLLGILVHTLDAEYGWRSVLQSLSADEILQPDDFSDLTSLKTRWEAEQSAWMAYVSSLNDADLEQSYGADPDNQLSFWHTLLHVITHGVHHRGEAAALLTGLGHSPGELDFDVYLWENPEI